MLSPISIIKRCISCDQAKPAPAFFATVLSPDGLTSSCRTCVLERARADRVERDRRRLERQAWQRRQQVAMAHKLADAVGELRRRAEVVGVL